MPDSGVRRNCKPFPNEPTYLDLWPDRIGIAFELTCRTGRSHSNTTMKLLRFTINPDAMSAGTTSSRIFDAWKTRPALTAHSRDLPSFLLTIPSTGINPHRLIRVMLPFAYTKEIRQAKKGRGPNAPSREPKESERNQSIRGFPQRPAARLLQCGQPPKRMVSYSGNRDTMLRIIDDSA